MIDEIFGWLEVARVEIGKYSRMNNMADYKDRRGVVKILRKEYCLDKDTERVLRGLVLSVIIGRTVDGLSELTYGEIIGLKVVLRWQVTPENMEKLIQHLEEETGHYRP